ncbi:MAG: OmpH family outer membrane protein [Prolixibacteraceae bacterium]|mgnify:FL=1|jgi:outer membrane protein|nr:OmpH family outer membrane protein [Prolixibacteraceae bacterium]MDI9563868.1 OmpH family outer membrane protein [Bacteroidota bacterium]NLS98474.1 OmpH family outer membrane protein [Bacteroidales bacterium]OQB82295.1 MAG: Outer membrane protein (OmpH-like) [Bacteroidetes bacterium ADurb.Bin123]HNU77817.1 OmpH family outer membrane protein [Prolixibacteraceae bacterium]
MKGSSLIVAILLFLAIAVLYVLHFTGKGAGEADSDEGEKTEIQNSLKIAYIKADSLILNYDLAQDLHDEFTKKQEAFTSEFGSKRSAFEKEATEFQQKLQRGGFLTEQRAIQERDRLVNKEQEIARLDQELSSKLAELQQSNNEQLIDSLISFLKIFNMEKKFDYILNGTDVLVGPEAFNITAEVLQQMNSRYKAVKPAE